MATAVDMDTADTAVDTAATDMGRGLLMLRPNPATAMVATVATDTAVVDMVVMAVATTAVVMEATDTAVATTAMARGRLRLSPATATAGATATARGLLSPAMDTAATAMVATDTAGATATAGDTATGVSYHQIRRSELSQKQNYKNSQR